MPLWWINFIDPHFNRPLGVVIILGSTIDEAIYLSREFGCNPGGRYQAFQIPPESIHKINLDDTARLLTMQEAKKYE